MDNAEDLFRRTGTMLEGHFLLSSGLHSPIYWEKFRILQHPEFTGELCRLIADQFRGIGVGAVAGPALGGAVLAYEVARLLGVKAVYAERGEEGRAFRRGQAISPGEKVLIVDDVLTTGGSLREMLEAVRKAGGSVVGIGVVVDRSGGVDFGVPFFRCYRASAPIYRPEECPLCRQGVPLQRLGAFR